MRIVISSLSRFRLKGKEFFCLDCGELAFVIEDDDTIFTHALAAREHLRSTCRGWTGEELRP